MSRMEAKVIEEIRDGVRAELEFLRSLGMKTTDDIVVHTLWSVDASGDRCGNAGCVALHGKGSVTLGRFSERLALTTYCGEDTASVSLTFEEAEALRDDLDVALAEMRGS